MPLPILRKGIPVLREQASPRQIQSEFLRSEVPGNPKKSIFVKTIIPRDNVKTIPLYTFYRHKYGQELLIDVLSLDYVKEGIRRTPVHRESFFQIILFTQGCEEVAIDGCRRTVRPGEVACSRPGEVWTWKADPQLEGYVLIFEEQFLLSFFNDPHFLDHFPYLQADRPSPFLFPDAGLQERLLHLFRLMKAEIDDAQNKDQHILRAMLYEALMLLNRAENAAGDNSLSGEVSPDRYMDRFTRLANISYREHRDVEYYADQLCITSNYLNRLVSQHFGVTTKQYLNRKLVDEVKRLLAYTSMPVNEIADTLHFESPSYFVRFFRKAVGQTPTQYRDEASKRA